MGVQVLVAAMHQKDKSLLQKINIRCDAIVGNQCEENSIEKFEWHGHQIMYLNFAERGVGLNRNNALMRATGDICLFADDDMRYYDDYVEKVENAFYKLPHADIIVFNIYDPTSERRVISKLGKVNYFNYLRYGTVRIAVKLSSIRNNAIYFNQCFGGGTEHCHGEDNLFLTSCLNKKLKIYAVPEYIAELTEVRQSTWNKGYDEKYLRDQGALYRAISRKWWRLLCLQDALRHSVLYQMKMREAIRVMLSGGKANQ